MKKALSVVLVVVVGLGLILSGCAQQAPSPAQVQKIKIASAGPPSMASRKLLEKSIDILKQKSNGIIQPDYFESGVLFPEGSQLESCSNGVVQISSAPSGNFWSSLGIVYDVRFLPFGYDPIAFGKYYRESGGFYDFMDPYFKKNNLKLLAWLCQGGVQAFFKTPVKLIEDMKGKVVAAPAGNGTLIAKALGMTPTAVLGPDLLLAYQKGTIDGNIGSSENSMIGYGAISTAKYEVVANFWEGAMPLVCNLAWLNSLPADLQKTVLNIYIDLEKEHYSNYDKIIQADRDEVKKQGGQLYELPKAEFARWQAAIQPIYDDTAKKFPDEWKKFWEATKKIRW